MAKQTGQEKQGQEGQQAEAVPMPLHPNQLIRPVDAPKYYGLKRTALGDAIKRGDIEPPIPLTPNGRAKAFTGAQIIRHQQRMAALAKRG